MTTRTYIHSLQDILNESQQIALFIAGFSYANFKKDAKTVYAVIRALEIIGEAAKRIPKPVKDKYPNIPWRVMAGMRDQLIHGNFGVKLKVVWVTATEDVPPLIPVLIEALAQEQE